MLIFLELEKNLLKNLKVLKHWNVFGTPQKKTKQKTEIVKIKKKFLKEIEYVLQHFVFLIKMKFEFC